MLEGDYEQEAQGTRRGTILAVAGPPAGGRGLDPLAAARFPRRALRAKPVLPAFGPLVVTGNATLDGRVSSSSETAWRPARAKPSTCSTSRAR